MNYQQQLAIDFMAKLSIHAAAYQVGESEYNSFWLDAMDVIFNRVHEEVYGYLPHGS